MKLFQYWFQIFAQAQRVVVKVNSVDTLVIILSIQTLGKIKSNFKYECETISVLSSVLTFIQFRHVDVISSKIRQIDVGELVESIARWTNYLVIFHLYSTF